MHITNETFIVQLAVGQLTAYLKNTFPALAAEPQAPKADAKPADDGPTFTGRLVYSIKGIEDLFNVSHKKA